MFPGSPLHIYDSDPCVTRQIDFARSAFAAGVPVWGSCWGLQGAVVAWGIGPANLPLRLKQGKVLSS